MNQPMLRPGEDVLEQSDPISTYEAHGMVVRRLTENKRTVEPLSSIGGKLLHCVVEFLGKRNITPDDMLITELVNGYILEIPRIERSMVFRDLTQNISSVAIRTPTHGSVMTLDGDNMEVEKWGEMLVFNMEERKEPSGMMSMVAGLENIPKPKIDVSERASPAWYSDELYQRSEKEVAAKGDENEQRKMEIIGRVKARFPKTANFMSIPNAGNIRIYGMRLNVIGEIFGIRNPESSTQDRLLLAAKIYGEENVGVQRATQIIIGTRMKVYERAQRVMVR